MLSVSVSALRVRGEALRDALARDGVEMTLVESDASVGGGAYPTARIPSVALAIGRDATATERRLRLGDPPVIGRLVEGKLLVDLRTISPGDDAVLQGALAAACRPPS
jgi:L-seryl-tRNA(Ser) seleniumtransferase